MLALQRDVLPNSKLACSGYLKKLGKEHYLLLPTDGQDLLPAQTNGILIISEGVDPDLGNSRIGTGVATFRLESLGSLATQTAGTGTLVPSAGHRAPSMAARPA